MKGVDDLRKAREQRLLIGGQGSQAFRYVLCMLLATNALASYMILFLSTPKAAFPALSMYCFSVWIILMIVVLHSNPYAGVMAIEPTSLERIVKSIQ